jgi:hypothetical protein
MRPTLALAAITLALTGVAVTSGPASAKTVILSPGTYTLAQMDLGHITDTLDLTASAGITTFVLTGGDTITFAVRNGSTPAGGTTNPDYMVKAGDAGGNFINLFQSTPGAGQVVTIVGAAIPEPATWAMVLLGVGLIGGGLRMSASGSETSSPA